MAPEFLIFVVYVSACLFATTARLRIGMSVLYFVLGGGEKTWH